MKISSSSARKNLTLTPYVIHTKSVDLFEASSTASVSLIQ